MQQEKWNNETRKQNEQSQKHKDKFRYFHHLKDKCYKEISDVLNEVLGFNLEQMLLKFILRKKFTTSVFSSEK